MKETFMASIMEADIIVDNLRVFVTEMLFIVTGVKDYENFTVK